MEITLKSLSLTNFKGIRSETFHFGQNTNIRGANATGKTTIVDAFLWLLFEKDSSDRTSFEIKTLGPDNQPYHELSHEVSALLWVDGDEINIKRVLREKWTKKKGSAVREFTGHEKEHFWNDVPCSEKEFVGKVSSLIVENQFKLLTNLAHFNTVLKWQDRRSLLLQLAGGISDLDFAKELNTDRRYDHLIKALTSKKTLEEYRKEIVSKKNKIKQESEFLPQRIDEARRSMPDKKDYSAMKTQVERLTEDLRGVEELLSNKSAAEKERQKNINAFLIQRGDLERKVIQLENEERNSLTDNKQKRQDSIATVKRLIASLEDERSELLRDYDKIAAKKTRLLSDKSVVVSDKNIAGEQWDKISAEQFSFDPNLCKCPTCKQDLPNVDAAAQEQELRNNFNKSKSERLNKVAETGKRLKLEEEEKEREISLVDIEINNIIARGESKKNEIAGKKKELSVLEEDHVRRSSDEDQELKDKIANNQVIINLKAQIKNLTDQIEAPVNDGNNSELQERKRNLQAEINAVNKELALEQMGEKIQERIKELEKQETESAQAIAELEGYEFSILEYDKAKMDLVENKINDKFRLVKFKLFDRQINGGESPACVTLINGVPYPDANTASKINASLDIIRVFSDHYGVKAPVFIDNRESVTNIIDTGMQIINLIVSPEHKQLTVEREERKMATLFS